MEVKLKYWKWNGIELKNEKGRALQHMMEDVLAYKDLGNVMKINIKKTFLTGLQGTKYKFYFG